MPKYKMNVQIEHSFFEFVSDFEVRISDLVE